VSFSDVLNFLDVLSGSAGGTRPRPGPVRRRRRAGQRRQGSRPHKPRQNQIV
jgi:hypothetical protein